MREFRIKNDLQRAVNDAFAWPLGIVPGTVDPPSQGFVVTYNPSKDEEPDTYTFHVVMSHERVGDFVRRCFELLPDRVYAIVEVGSRDAYRAVDVYLGSEPISRDEFIDAWRHFEPFLLEDVSVAAGANSDDPYIEVFIEQWKDLLIHVPLMMRDEIESLAGEFGLSEIDQIELPVDDDEDAMSEVQRVRPVLDLVDEYSPDVDELLLQLRYAWRLELDVDPEANLDDNGRDLGLTLWHAVVILVGADSDEDTGAYASFWATARSITEMEDLIEVAVLDHLEWIVSEIYTIDRVAYDERPDELSALAPRRTAPEMHLVQIDPWPQPPEGRPPRDAPSPTRGAPPREAPPGPDRG